MGKRAAAHVMLLSSLALPGCQAAAPTESPHTVAETVVAAFDQGDVERFLAVLPSEESLGRAFDCGRADTLRAALRRRLDELRSEFDSRKQANFRMRLLAFDEPGSETLELAPGDVFQGCTARTALTVHRARVSIARKRGGRNDDSHETWTFMRFDADGPWYYGKF